MCGLPRGAVQQSQCQCVYPVRSRLDGQHDAAGILLPVPCRCEVGTRTWRTGFCVLGCVRFPCPGHLREMRSCVTHARSPFNTRCPPFLAGRWANSSVTAATSCQDCPAGRFAPLAGAGACVTCPVATYTTAAAAVTCTACPTLKTSPAGSTSFAACVNCVAGQMFNQSLQCEDCPRGTLRAYGCPWVVVGGV